MDALNSLTFQLFNFSTACPIWPALVQKAKKKPAAPYSRAGGSRTTLGEEALDFRVRDGNGYCRLSMATGRKPEIGSEENRNAERQEPHTW